MASEENLMKITIETDNKHVLTEYIQPTDPEVVSTSATEASESTSSATDTSSTSAASDPFAVLLQMPRRNWPPRKRLPTHHLPQI